MTSRLRFASDRRSWPRKQFILWSLDREEPSTVPGMRERERDIGPAVNVEGLHIWLPWLSFQSPSLLRSVYLEYVHEPGRCCTLGIHNASHIRDIIIPGITPLPASPPLPIYSVPLGKLPSPGRCTGRRQFVSYFPLFLVTELVTREETRLLLLSKQGPGPFLSCSLLILHNRYSMTYPFQVQRGKVLKVGGHLYGVF